MGDEECAIEDFEQVAGNVAEHRRPFELRGRKAGHRLNDGLDLTLGVHECMECADNLPPLDTKHCDFDDTAVQRACPCRFGIDDRQRPLRESGSFHEECSAFTPIVHLASRSGRMSGGESAPSSLSHSSVRSR